MSELRYNPLLGDWLATATERQERTFHPPPDYCPLCPTKPGGFATEVPESTYDIVTFENKFPSFRRDPPNPAIEGNDFYPVRPAQGVCEVVLYSPDHNATLAGLPAAQIYKLILAWIDRYKALSELDFVKYVFIFENKGKEIGVTLSHPHGQIYAYPFVPPVIVKELEQCFRHKEATGNCLLCDILKTELHDGDRIVIENDSFGAYVPFFARWPYEVHISPKRHRTSMLEFTSKEQRDLAAIMKQLLGAYDGIFNKSMPYMMNVHQAPTDDLPYDHYHFHIEFYPPLRQADKLKYLAGSETGAGMFINDTLAEEKAAELRKLVKPVSMVTGDHVAEVFKTRYGTDNGLRFFRAPGRVNLIGEHTDYNDGFVLPVAIDREVVVAARARDDRTVRVHSVNFGEGGSFDLDKPQPITRGYWLNFIEGTACVLEKHGHSLVGADIVIESSVPVGGGLSSSAAVETATAYTMLSLARIPVDRKEMALACQQAEHEYSGANVGIMDQYISALGQEQAALLIDCRSLESTPVYVDSKNYALIVCNTGVKHDLGTSAYNDRRRECEEAARNLRSNDLEPSLRDVSKHDLMANRDKLPEMLYKRAHHVITENARVLAAVEALHDEDFDRLGRLMYQSHESLRDDYEVSSLELDAIVEASNGIPGVAGTRMTGGGFGGCTVSFVMRERIPEFKERMTKMYQQRFSRELTIYDCEIVDGASEI